MEQELLQPIFGGGVAKSSRALIQLLHFHEYLPELEFQRAADGLNIFQQSIHRDQMQKLLHGPLNRKVLESPPL